MTTMTELWVDRGDYRQTQQVSGECPKPAEGEILLAIDKFAMTANNVSYACLLYTSPSPRDRTRSRMPSSA